MCGIVGYVGHREVVPVLIDGLKKLEYRGYDSAGIVVVRDGELATVKAEGKLERLTASLATRPIAGSHGLGHTPLGHPTGPPLERNAHPIVDSRERVALIHNGIIENFLEIKQRLTAEGWGFTSDTDTEVIANLISSYLDDDLRAAVTRACRELEGMYAFAAVDREAPEQEIVVARKGPPLLLGLGSGRAVPGLRSGGSPGLHPRGGLPRERRYRPTHPRRSRRDRSRRPGPSSERPSASIGIRCRSRRAATSTSCSRRSTNSRRRYRTPWPRESTSSSARLDSSTSTSPSDALKAIDS